MRFWKTADRADAIAAAPAENPDLVRLRRVLELIYWTLLFEGIVRKWMLPHFQQQLFFLRDPMVLYAYYLAFRTRAWSRPSWMLVVGLLFGLVGVLDGFAFLTQGELTPTIILYGWRNYFYYLPLAFLIGRVFLARDMDRLLKWTLLLALPIAPLSALQAVSPADALINKGFGEGENALENVGVMDSVQRATGIFFSIPGHAIFVASCVAFLLILGMRQREERLLSTRWLLAVGVAALFNIFVSGSRTAYYMVGIVVLGTMAAEAGAGRVGKVARVGVLVVLLGSCGCIAAVAFFPEVIDAMISRWTMTTEGEGGVLSNDRVTSGLVHFWSLIDEVPLMGYGLGSAGNGARRLGMEIPFDVEEDWDRHIVELGSVLGLGYIIYRWILVAWLGWLCWRAAVRFRSSEAIILYMFILPTLFMGQITGQGSVQGYGWIFAGFCLASCRWAEEKARAARPAFPRSGPTVPRGEPYPAVPNPRWASSWSSPTSFPAGSEPHPPA